MFNAIFLFFLTPQHSWHC